MKGFWSTSLTAGARPVGGDTHASTKGPRGLQRWCCFFVHTKDGVPSVGVAAEVEDVRVISSNYGQGVVDAGHETRPADGSVHFHSFIQSLLGLAFVVSVINTPPWRRHRTKHVLAPGRHSWLVNLGMSGGRFACQDLPSSCQQGVNQSVICQRSPQWAPRQSRSMLHSCDTVIVTHLSTPGLLPLVKAQLVCAGQIFTGSMSALLRWES